MSSSLEILLSYASEDLKEASDIHERLVDHDYKVFFDRRSILGGRDWEREILTAIDRVDGVFVIPLLLDGTPIPQRFAKWQAIDMRDVDWFNNLLRSLDAIPPRGA
jgi:hypothetical protein